MRLIDADELSKKLLVTTIFIKDGAVFQRMINDSPTIEAVEVVRCGECRHKHMKDFDMFCPYMVGMIKPNMHCSYGERREP